MRRSLFTFAFVLLAGCLNLRGTTYYISNGGLDTNAGTSKTTSWAHLPGMLTCTNTCSSTTPAAGDNFILKGGDTWGAANLGIAWDWSGTSGSQIYIGVDQTWFDGGSWTRPIFTCGGTACAGTGLKADMWVSGASYFTVDNIEFTGYHTAGGTGGNIVYNFAPNQTYEHLYIHGWSHTATGDSDSATIFGWGGEPNAGSCVHDTVIDGSDTTMDMMAAFNNTVPCAYNNIVRYVSNGFEATGSNWHDNQVGPIGQSFSSGAHQNAMFNFGPDNGATTMFIYNNVIANTIGSICGSVCGGIVKLWLSGNEATTATGYAFGNVIYDNVDTNLINVGNSAHGAENFGTWNFFNNVVECGSDSSTGACFRDTGATQIVTFNSQNNFWISSTSPAVSCTVFTCTSTTDLLLSVAAAASQGYTSGSAAAFNTTSGAGNTVGAGTQNYSGICSTINGISTVAGTACRNATGYACTYITSNHTVSCPSIVLVARPSSAAWDIGAYQWNGSVSPSFVPLVSPFVIGRLGQMP